MEIVYHVYFRTLPLSRGVDRLPIF